MHTPNAQSAKSVAAVDFPAAAENSVLPGQKRRMGLMNISQSRDTT
jgi:hypothetical protein